MARRRNNRPIEILRTTSRSTADLEETLAEMFHHPDPAAGGFPSPAQIAVEDVSTPVDSTPEEITLAESPDRRPKAAAGLPESSQSDVDTGVKTSVPDHPVHVITPVNQGSGVFNLVNTTGALSRGDVFTPVKTSPVLLTHARKRLFQCLRASEGHTDGEHRLYRFMWEQGREYVPLVRLYAGSISTLARALGRDDRNTRPLVESLIRKLAIQVAREQDFRTRHPRIYYIFEESEILARREKAGLAWALKNKGVQLLTEEEARRVTAAEPVSTPVDISLLDLTPVKTVLRDP